MKWQILTPKLLAQDEFNLVFAAEYAGKEMPVYMENAGLEDIKDKVKQAVEIIGKISEANKKQHPFVLPVRFEKFIKFYDEGKFGKLLDETNRISSSSAEAVEKRLWEIEEMMEN